MIFIVGSRGRLGQSILGQYNSSDVVCIERAVYESWAAPDSDSSIAGYFSEHVSEGSVVYICSGLLNPRLPVEELHDVNFRLPRNIVRAIAPLGFRTVTFGTAMEGTLRDNAYVQSKLMLSQFVEQMSGEDFQPTHVRIHTLYGSAEPSPFMFLGQILNSIRTNTPFEMTQGRQLREYHHVDDDAYAIKSLVDRNITGIVELSHGSPISLKALAEAIFQALEKPRLLRLGALPEPAQENFNNIFIPPAAIKDVEFRESLGAVVEYMKTLAHA